MKKKRVIVSVTNDLNYDQRVKKTCDSLSKYGYDIILVGRELPYSDFISRPYKTHRFRLLFNKGPLFYLEYNLRLALYLLLNSADILWCNDVDTSLGNLLASKFKKCALVFDAHEIFSEVPEIVNKKWVKRVWDYLEKKIVFKANLNITVSQSIVEYYQKKYNKSFLLLRNFPIKNTLSTGKRNGYILYQGMVNEGRGLKESILAMKKVSTKLHIAGHGDVIDELKDLVLEENLTDKVKFLGLIKPEDLPELTANYSIGLNLLENKGLNYYYSAANKLFDYVQAEVPSLNMAFPEYVHLNEEYKVSDLLDKLDSDTIASKINMLLNQPEEYQMLKINCKQAKKVWVWDNDFENIIKDLKSC